MIKRLSTIVLFVVFLVGCVDQIETAPEKLPPPKTCGDIVFTYISSQGSEFTGNLHHGYGFKVGVMAYRNYGQSGTIGQWFNKLGSGDTLKVRIDCDYALYFYDDKGVQIGFMKFYNY
jgi:hypothetical protein